MLVIAYIYVIDYLWCLALTSDSKYLAIGTGT